jgi:hypothetical protein
MGVGGGVNDRGGVWEVEGCAERGTVRPALAKGVKDQEDIKAAS